MHDRDTIIDTKVRGRYWCLSEHTFENKGAANRGNTCTGCHPASGGKHKYTVTLETNTSPVEGAGVREHGCVTGPTSRGPTALLAVQRQVPRE